MDTEAQISFVSQDICPAGSYCIDGVKHLCPAGRYGNAIQASSALCSGPCAAGWYCPLGSIRSTMHPCGGTQYYCPAESEGPTVVSDGFYTTEADPTVVLVWNHSDSKDVHRGDTKNVTAGEIHQWTRARQEVCPPGYYCTSGLRLSCPAGRYGARKGLSTDLCSGACSEGYYCPMNSSSSTQIQCGAPWFYCPTGSRAPLLVQEGYYSVNADGYDGDGESDLNMGPVKVITNATMAVQSLARSTRADQRLCESGYYCLGGLRSMCPPGRYGTSYGLSSSNCSGVCKEGYYCPQGSTLATQLPCGDPSLFCLEGVWKPMKASLGYYTIGNGSDVATVSTRINQVIAPLGYYAIHGILLPCPAGYYGSSEGLYSSSCSGPCMVRGFYCPVASTSPMQYVCGGDDVYCDGDRTVAPVHVLPGFYTTDYSSLFPSTRREYMVSSEDNPSRLEYSKHITVDNTVQVKLLIIYFQMP